MIKQKLLSLFVALFATTALWASNTITYTADAKLTRSSFNVGQTTFGPAIISHTFSNGIGTITCGGEITTIKDHVFNDCRSLTSITIPNSVTTIENYAFNWCSGLTSITIGNSVTTIGDEAFEFCSGLKKTNYTGTIADWCKIKFSGSSSNPMYYSKNFFINDVEVKDLVIPAGVDTIGNFAFDNCSGLTSVTIPNSVTKIGSCAFYWCSGLTSVTIGNSVTTIGYYAFSGCSGLASITIPNSVTTIEESAFYGCTGLTSPVYNANSFAYMPTSYIGAYTIPDGIQQIAGYAFHGCTGLTSITIPNSVTTIGNYAFSNCSGLTSVTIPNSVTTIEESAFYGCTGLTSPVYNANCFAYMPPSYEGAYTIPDGIKQIAGGAFYWCSGLTSVTIPNSVTTIGSYAFYRCSGLTSVTIGNSVTTIEDYAFLGCSGLTSPVYNANCFAYMPPSYEGAYTIPDGIKQIAGGAFSDCEGLTSVTIGNSVTTIGDEAFYSCTKLTLVTLENYFTSYRSRSFPSSAKIVYANPITISIVDRKIYSVTAVMSIPSIYDDGYDEIGLADGQTSTANHYVADASGKIEFANMPLNYSGTYYFYARRGEEYVYQGTITVSTKTPSLSCSVNSQLFAIILSNISASTDESVQTLTKGIKYNGQYYEADKNNTVTLSDLQLGQSYTIYLYGCYNGEYYEQSKTVSTQTPSLSCSSSATQTTITLSNIYASSDTSVHTLSLSTTTFTKSIARVM